MIFADKLIELRKKNGWSQEELAEQLGVSRQAVSKWEGAQSIPDLDKIIRLSKLFGVSTDYLLKDEVEEVEHMDTEELREVRIVSMEEANTFLEIKKTTSKGIALGAFLCILSPIPLILLGVLSESSAFGIAENVAGGMGMIILLVLVAVAVAIFITIGSKTACFEYLEQEVFETEYGVSGMVKSRKEQYHESYIRKNILGTMFCILSLIPLFTGIILNESNDIFIVCGLLLMLLMIGIGVYIFIENNVIWESFEKILQEGDYTKAKKKQPVLREIGSAYWIIATAIYLAWSFSSNHWEYTWVVWLLAAGLYPVVMMIAGKLFEKK